MGSSQKKTYRIKKSTQNNNIQKAKVNDRKRDRKSINVNIGIDFGTSYTKVGFSDSKDSFEFVKFEKDEYRPSIIYFDFKRKKIYYKEPPKVDNIEKIEYFKYSMIDDSLPKSDNLSSLKLNVKPPEIICSLFFLVCVINESKEYIYNHYKRKSTNINIEGWSITMGVPIDNYEDKNHQLYERLLNIANKMSNSYKNDSISIIDLNNYYQENKNIPIPRFRESNINTLPELYAESLAFLQSPNVMAGVYALVYIGGGTVDLAIMFKEIIKKDIDKFSIVSKNIEPLGVEFVVYHIVCDKKDNKHAKNELEEKKDILDNRYFSIEKEYKEKFKKVFATIVDDLRRKNVRVDFKHVIENNRTLPIIICGGGANYKWYKDGISKTSEQLKPISKDGVKFKFLSVEELLPENINNHRLLIAHTLAQRIEDIPDLDGFPWYFSEINRGTVEKGLRERYEEGREKQIENYENPV
jgi:hypothetical protein